MTKVFAAASTAGRSTVILWNGGEGTGVVHFSSGSGTCKCEFSPDAGTTWMSVGSDGEFTATGAVNFTLPRGFRVSMAITSPSGLSLNAWIVQNNRRSEAIYRPQPST